MTAEFDGIAWAARETALRQCVGHIRPKPQQEPEPPKAPEQKQP